jgi:hypothetical protein
MGTAQVEFAWEQWGVNGSGPDQKRRKLHDRKWRHGSMFCACPDFPRAFFLTIVVQVPWLPEVTEGHVTPKGFPWSMRKRKLRNIRPSRAFSPVVTSVTWPRRRLPWVCASATGRWGFQPFYRVFSDMLCSTPRLRENEMYNNVIYSENK